VNVQAVKRDSSENLKPGQHLPQRPRLPHPVREGIMDSVSDPHIPSLPADVVEGLPIWYRCMARHLAKDGRVKIVPTGTRSNGPTPAGV